MKGVWAALVSASVGLFSGLTWAVNNQDQVFHFLERAGIVAPEAAASAAPAPAAPPVVAAAAAPPLVAAAAAPPLATATAAAAGTRPKPEFRPAETDLPQGCRQLASTIERRAPTEAHGLTNLALLRDARANASSVVPGKPLQHSIANLNDGWYGDCRSWIPNAMPGWAAIDLGAEYEISMVTFGNSVPGTAIDRAATDFRISVATEAHPNMWQTVYAAKPNEEVRARREFPFGARKARFVKIDVNASVDGDARIDEIEVYGHY